MSSKGITNIDEISIQLERTNLGIDYVPITGAKQVADLVRKIISKEEIEVREKMVALYLNRKNDVIGYFIAGVGGVSNVPVDMKIVLGIAVKALASGIILCHNHPSGNLDSSLADLDITKKLSQAANYHDIVLLDHIIVTKESYSSHAEEGLMGLSKAYPIVEEFEEFNAVELIDDEPLEGVRINENKIERLTKELKKYIDENAEL